VASTPLPSNFTYLRAHDEQLLRLELVKDVQLMACFRRNPPRGLIFHSDRGSQYCRQEFQDTLAAWGMRSSMSRKGNCHDDAPTESLWGHLRTACVPGRRFATRDRHGTR
jgi:transposase InsO family protein